MTNDAAARQPGRRWVPTTRTRWTLATGAVAVLALAGCGSSATSKAGAASQCTPGTGLTKTVATAHYTMVLDVNPMEAMYTPAQVAAQHPKTGEVMVRGEMSDMSGAGTSGSSTSTMMGAPSTMMGTTSTMPMSQTTAPAMDQAGIRHLEVHICSASTGQVVQDARPTITVLDHAKGGMIDTVPVAVMQGIGAGVADLHYGNNVTLPAGHRYTVTVRQNNESATFDFTGPS